MTTPDYRVYVVLDPGLCGGLEGLIQTATLAAEAGAGFIQLRAPQWKKREWVAAARAIKSALAPTPARLIINDHVDVALLTDADGVHVGQADLSVQDVRSLIGPDKLLGLSISHPDQLHSEELALVDYLGVGPVWPTTSKADADPALGVEGLKTIVEASPIPTVAIGGITLNRTPDVMSTGVDGVAVISAICGQPDVKAATQSLLNAVQQGLTLQSHESHVPTQEIDNH